MNLSVDNRRCSISGAILFLFLLVFSDYANALSCFGLSDHFLLNCRDGTCKGAFRAKEVHGAGACGRRIVVESAPEDLFQVITRQVKQQQVARLDGLIQVTVIHRFYGDPPSSAEDLARAFAGKDLRAPRIQVQKIDNNKSVPELKAAWEHRARKVLVSTVIYRSIDWGLLAGGLILLFKTIATYRRNLITYFDGKRENAGVARPLIIQTILFVVSSFFLIMLWDFPLIALTAPLLLLVWIFEASISVVYWLKSSRVKK